VKDISCIFILIGIVILFYMLQIYVFNTLTFFGVKANIMLTFCVVLAIWFKPSISIPFVFFIGIVSDLIFTFSIGKYLIAYLILTLVIIAVSSIYNKQNRGATVLIVLIATIFAEYIFGIYSLVKFGTLANFFSVTFIGIKGAVINVILGVILSNLLKGLAEKRN